MEMDKLVSLCKRRGFLFQSSEIYGGLNGFWDYGPLGVELKRNIKEAWWRDMVTGHDDLAAAARRPEAYEMVGLDARSSCTRRSGSVAATYDLFVDKMVDCRESKKRYRYDQVPGRWVEAKGQTIFVTTAVEENHEAGYRAARPEILQSPAKDAADLRLAKPARLAGQNRPGSDTTRCSARTPRRWARSPRRATST